MTILKFDIIFGVSYYSQFYFYLFNPLACTNRQIDDIPTSPDNSITSVFQHGERNPSRKPGKGCHKCEHCHKLGHKIDQCYALHGCPPHSAAMV